MPQTKPLNECVAGDDLEHGRVEYHLQNGALVRLRAGIEPFVFHNPAQLDQAIAQKTAELGELQTAKAEYLKLLVPEEPTPP